MTPELSFESLSCKPFLVDGNLTDNAELDLNVNFFQSISSLNIKNFDVEGTKTFVNDNIYSNSYSVLHINNQYQEYAKKL